MRIIYNICEICHHLRLYKSNFSKFFFAALTCLVHGLILSKNTVGLKKIADDYIKGKSQQSLSYFLHSSKSAAFNMLHNCRLNIQLNLANKLNKTTISFFIIDDYLFKKKKGKKTQVTGYNFCHDAKKSRKSQCIVSSSILINNYHIPFKQMLYVGKKYVSKLKFKKNGTWFKPYIAIS